MKAIAFVVIAAVLLVFGGAPVPVQAFGLATLAIVVLVAIGAHLAGGRR